jgi:protein-tyrosine phosphatase
MGNICRSPTAEGVFRHLVAEAGLTEAVFVDSAGTHAYHVNEPPDRRSRAAAQRRGISLDEIRARRVDERDFERFDYVVAMDRDNHAVLLGQAEPGYHGKIRLFMEFSPGQEEEVPDPYYGGASGFERVLDLVEDAARGLLADISDRHLG